jgi:hypothetical protein
MLMVAIRMFRKYIESTAAKRIMGFSFLAVVVFFLILGFLAYIVTYVDPTTGDWHDGLGRPLFETPMLVRLFLGQDRLWAGWLWAILDMGILVAVAGLGTSVASYVFGED